MDNDLDALLRAELLQPPVDFTKRVMQQLKYFPIPARRSGLLEKLQSLALIIGGIVGAAQLAAFMFGIWTASSAG